MCGFYINNACSGLRSYRFFLFDAPFQTAFEKNQAQISASLRKISLQLPFYVSRGYIREAAYTADQKAHLG